MLKKTIKGVCTSTVVEFPDPLFPTPLPLKNMKIPENTEKDSYDPKPAGEGYIWMEYSWLVREPKFKNSNKKVTCMNLGHYRCHLIIWHLSGTVGAVLTEFYSYLDHKAIVTYDFGARSKSLIPNMLGGVEWSASHSEPIYPQGYSLLEATGDW